MKKNKIILSLLALGALSSSVLTSCGLVNQSSEVTDDQKDQNAADEVKTLIDALSDTSTESEISAARTAYDALTATQKSLVTNYAKLVVQEKRVADAKAVQNVISMIAALTDSSTEAEVNAAFAAYLALDDELKAKVTNSSVLLYQQSRLEAKPVVDAIEALTFTAHSAEEEAAIEAARNLYDALSEDGKSFVTNYTKLTELEEAVDDYYISPVIAAIEALSFNPEGTNQEAEIAAIEAARAAYDKLSQARKAKVTNYAKLTGLEAAVVAYNDAKAIANLENSINELIMVDELVGLDVALAQVQKIQTIKDNAYFEKVSSTAKKYVEDVETSFNNTYTKLSDSLTGIAGEPQIAKVNDDVYGEVTSVKGTTDGVVQVTYGEADPTNYDYLAVLVKSAVTGSFNLWGPKWEDDHQSFTLIADKWTLLKINVSIFEDANLSTYDFVLEQYANEHEILFSSIYGYNVPFIGTRDEVVYSSCPIQSPLNGYAAFGNKGVDDKYGNYTTLDLAGSGDSLNVFLNGTKALPTDKYSSIKFALYNPTEENAKLSRIETSNADWNTLVSVPGSNNLRLSPGWNVITIDALPFENENLNFTTLIFDFSQGGKADGWKISEFIASPSSLVATSLRFGQFIETGEKHSTYGEVYNLTQQADYVGVNNDVFGCFSKDVLRNALPTGKTTFVFEMFNPTESEVRVFFAGGDPWSNGSSFNCQPNAWTKIVLSAEDIAINATGQLFVYARSGENASANVAGWKITDIYTR